MITLPALSMYNLSQTLSSVKFIYLLLMNVLYFYYKLLLTPIASAAIAANVLRYSIAHGQAEVEVVQIHTCRHVKSWTKISRQHENIGFLKIHPRQCLQAFTAYNSTQPQFLGRLHSQ